MTVILQIKNAPKIEMHNVYVAFRVENGEAVYHGQYKEEVRAMAAAKEIDGMYVRWLK